MQDQAILFLLKNLLLKGFAHIKRKKNVQLQIIFPSIFLNIISFIIEDASVKKNE